jgi:hypothetical protein
VRMIAILITAAASLSPTTCERSSQSASTGPPRIEEMMSAKEFEAAGLRKLSPEELSALNTWLAGYSQFVTQMVAQRTSAVSALPANTPDVIETRIAGEFTGWDGETIFKLQNGQIWQQSAYAYTYHYAYAPKVLIYKSGGVHKMKVDQLNGEITVRRIN